MKYLFISIIILVFSGSQRVVFNKQIDKKQADLNNEQIPSDQNTIEDFFNQDYQYAIDFIKNQSQFFLLEAGNDTLKTTILTSVIFPEILRYSYFRDFFETKALEIVYIAKGREYADFSIGHFQMKPSFVEKLEKQLMQYELLAERYDSIFYATGMDEIEIRQQRIDRLSDISWQWIYARVFYDLMIEKYPLESFSSEEHMIRFFATAYNYDFTAGREKIDLWSNKKVFPYGIRYDNPFTYSEISWHFYAKENKILFTNYNISSI
ncbi:hypothetical protein ACFLQ9_00400 [Bacteroidota bacterium]